ncbi:hypothetical protein ACRBEV_32960 (plasmid) [Methylobacterium phyllosphaerae]
MRFALLTAVLLTVSLTSRAEEASTALTASCAQATSSLERHDLECPDDDVLQAFPDNDPSY